MAGTAIRRLTGHAYLWMLPAWGSGWSGWLSPCSEALWCGSSICPSTRVLLCTEHFRGLELSEAGRSVTVVTADLEAVVDAAVSTTLIGLSIGALQAQYAAVAPQVQRLTGFTGAVLAELHTRTAFLVTTAASSSGSATLLPPGTS